MKLAELFEPKTNLKEAMGIFGKQVRLKKHLTGANKEFAGKVGKIINIAPDRDFYFIEFDDDKIWVSAKDIEGVKR